ncbi:MAG: hypothetical protein UU94_C0009G0011 [Candidatus Collierbacteria bacterium GW2011_GWB2_42_12]|nr:MAG: hypothetical protein UU94_C0009G0011 [Candidatus Collierbacteria bacterium GW2011_GWB2_42_12]
MEQNSVQNLLDESGGEPPSTNPGKDPGTNYVNNIIGTHVLWNRLCRDVFGHPKNLLDFKRQITRCGPLSIF